MPRGTPFKQGNSGKPKGAVNKTTKEIRESFQLLLENNLDNMSKWLERIARKDPDKAFNLMLQMAEYNIPKLARTEHVGAGGSELFKAFNNLDTDKV